MARSKADPKISMNPKQEKDKKNLASQKLSRKSTHSTTGVKREAQKIRSRPGEAALR